MDLKDFFSDSKIKTKFEEFEISWRKNSQFRF